MYFAQNLYETATGAEHVHSHTNRRIRTPTSVFMQQHALTTICSTAQASQPRNFFVDKHLLDRFDVLHLGAKCVLEHNGAIGADDLLSRRGTLREPVHVTRSTEVAWQLHRNPSPALLM
jgi:hypothetical protein